MPDSGVLKGLLGWMIVGVCFKGISLLQPANPSTGQVVATFLVGLLFKFMFGAFWSGFPMVYLSTMVAAAVFLIAMMTRGAFSRLAAQFAIATILWLSLFSLWVEPWLSPTGALVNVLLVIIGFFSVAVEIGVTIGWFVLWFWTSSEIKRKL